MKRTLWTKSILGCLVLMLVTFGSFGQEFSLDDCPTAMGTPPFCSAEDEFGVLGIGVMIGPSPSLAMFGFTDADVLMPGPAIAIPFPPPPLWVDGISADHSQAFPPNQIVGLRFSVDRVTGGLTPAEATWQQAAINEQCGDIFDSFMMGNNVLFMDQRVFGLTPMMPPVVPPITPGSHDNIDGYNDLPGPMMGFYKFFTLHPASGFNNGACPSDIFTCPPGPLFWPAPLFATAAQMGLVGGVPVPGGAPVDSIDALVVWDYATPGRADANWDFALFSLAPGSPTLAIGPWDGATIFATTFNGAFWVFAPSASIGVGPSPSPPLPSWQLVNVDALEVF